MQNHQNRRQFMLAGMAVGGGLILGKKGFGAEETEDKMNDVFDVIKHRRSVRNFKDTPVPQEHIDMILEAATWAPNPRNRQAWKFLVLNDRTVIDTLKEACIERFGEESREMAEMYFSAPVYVVVLADTNTQNPKNDVIGAAIAGQNLLLAARALGYGTVFITEVIPADITKEVLNIPDQYERVCITPIGVPVEWPESTGRKPLDEVVVYNEI